MKAIIGLGNPGDKYRATRHNIGFMALESYLDGAGFKDSTNLHCLLHESSNDHGEKLLFAEPQTYMNNSGMAVRAISDYFSLAPVDILVIYDELALPFGTIRTRIGGESAGHNGIKSIQRHLSDSNFGRLRLGIANKHSQRYKPETFVLKPFSRNEKKLLDDVFELTTPIIEQFSQTGELPAETYRLED